MLILPDHMDFTNQYVLQDHMIQSMDKMILKKPLLVEEAVVVLVEEVVEEPLLALKK
jgi:hypothetical protein